ncbi:MAG: aminodeoxychorismate lyase [Gammaproteobacteria bacterium]|nr:aminodeoxychorismate lyase [Gammaproteobacteria bacterium]NNJ97433.1 aminodeoxychorismate lyase [Gammaproteobacteria bacterium]
MTKTLINGIAAAYVSVADRGLNYGDGLFETIACIGLHPLFLEQHLQRMERGASVLDIPFPDTELFMHDIDAVLRTSAEARSVIKLLLTRGGSQRGYRYQAGQVATRICMGYPWPAHVAQWQRQGIRARFCRIPASINPHLAGIKSLNRLENVLASAELGREFDEGFLCDSAGHVVEGTMSNVFVVIDDTVVTPDLSRCGIAGIMRQLIIDSADEIGIGIEIGQLCRDDLLNSEEIFISNSVIGLCVLKQLEQQRYDRHMTAEAIRSRLKTKILTCISHQAA